MTRVVSSTPSETESDAGFTLAELLVALALMAVVLGLASGGIRFGVRTWEATRTIDRNDELAAARDMLAACLKTAVPLSSVDDEGRVALAFQGSRDRLSLVCPLGWKAGTYWRLDVHLSGSGPVLSLVASTAPFQRRRRARQIVMEAESHLLASQVAGLDIRYFGDLDDGAGAKFHDQWTHPNRLPQLVAVAVRFAGDDRRVWPVLAVAIGSSGS